MEKGSAPVSALCAIFSCDGGSGAATGDGDGDGGGGGNDDGTYRGVAKSTALEPHGLDSDSSSSLASWVTLDTSLTRSGLSLLTVNWGCDRPGVRGTWRTPRAQPCVGRVIGAETTGSLVSLRGAW